MSREMARDLGLDFVLSPDVAELADKIRPLVHHSRERMNALDARTPPATPRGNVGAYVDATTAHLEPIL